jgi:hypothetical protein
LTEKIYKAQYRKDSLTIPTKAATIALVVKSLAGTTPQIVDVLSDEREISVLETGWQSGEDEALGKVYAYRDDQAREDDEFADYVEDLLSQPFVKPEIQAHGVQWLKSKLRIEEFERNEREAAKIIAEYALTVYRDDPKRRDFLLAGPKAQVRVRIFVLDSVTLAKAA